MASAIKVTTKKTAAKVQKVAETPSKRKILFVASECTPFIVTGGLAEVIGSLSKALAATGNFDVRVVVPLYSDIKKEYRDKFTYLGNIYVHLAWRNQYCGIFKYEQDGVIFYFLDNEFYFKRPGCYGYFDDGERFAFFSRAVLEIMPFLNFYPDVMHCHDWQSALAAIYLKTNYCFRQEYQFIRALFTIHNIEYQGQYSLDILSSLFDIYGKYQYLVEYNNSINLMKGAIECCERFSTVSPRYAQEIKEPYYAHGMDPIVRRNEFKLSGILNGIDYDVYNPATNKSLFVNYSADSLDKKTANKTELQKMLGLNVDERAPLIAMVSRLVNHKGIGLVRSVFHDIMNGGAQLVVLGTGDADHENFFRHMQNLYGRRVHAAITFNKDLAQKIYAGADIFLMPSLSEPCGLSQMIALRYGTVPIVRSTGGLKDSIADCGDGHTGNGFVFGGANAGELLYAVKRAVGLYYDYGDIWNELRERASKCDFSWNNSAKTYQAFYDEMF